MDLVSSHLVLGKSVPLKSKSDTLLSLFEQDQLGASSGSVLVKLANLLRTGLLFHVLQSHIITLYTSLTATLTQSNHKYSVQVLLLTLVGVVGHVNPLMQFRACYSMCLSPLSGYLLWISY